MKTGKHECKRPHLCDLSSAQRGVVLSEYLICTAAVAFALFTPIPGLDENAFTFMLDALRGFQANTTYLMSQP